MIICLVPEKDHVRWGLGYLVGYLFFISLVLLSFLPKGLPRWMKNRHTDLQGGLLGGSVGLDVHTQRSILSFRLTI